MPALSSALAQTHEALYPRLEALTRQVEAVAARKPDAPVPAATRAAAEALLFDCGRFGPARSLTEGGSRKARRAALEPAPETFAAIATILGQALATLDAFETRHSEWSSRHNGFVWRLPRGELRPVQRLRPRATAPVDPRRDRTADFMRRKIMARLTERYEDGFAAGLKAAAASSSPVQGTDNADRA